MFDPSKVTCADFGVLLPNLRSLSVYVSALESIEEVVNMLSSRWAPGKLALVSTTSEEGRLLQVAQLQAFEIEIDGPGWMDDSHYLRMECLEEEGMRISWTSEDMTWFMA